MKILLNQLVRLLAQPLKYVYQQFQQLPHFSLVTCIPETPNYDLTKKAETIDINRF